MQYGGLQSDCDNLRAQLDEEVENGAALKTQLQKSQAEYQTLKSKYDKDVSARADELDELRSVSLPAFCLSVVPFLCLSVYRLFWKSF